ncbi:domain XH [Artemisia annua]|uniref:Domain XH n=1 Tax=Artemisia annua TaxID=35608 RepID=A0A2U1MIR6_ARTAN|nr:domain XH [Artemisia annua]
MTGMDHSSEDVGEASDCDIEEYEEKAYEELKGGKHQINLPNNAFTCPYCSTNASRDYQYKELLQHATMVGKTDSKKRSKRERGSHLALAKYLEKDLTEAVRQSQPKCDVDCLTNHDGDEMFVWPWKVIVANLPTRSMGGLKFGQSDSEIRKYLATKGFNPKQVHSLWSLLNQSDSTFAVIDFGKDWLGFYNAMRFEKAYEVDHHGKEDWISENGSKSGIYGWVARGDDYTSINVYGRHLRNSADVMTLSDIMADENSKRYKLKENLTKISEARKRKYEEMERNYMETKNTLSKLIAEKDQIYQSHNEDMRKMNVLDLENAKLKTELESQLCKMHALAQENGKLKEEITFQQKELEQRAKERDERESQMEKYLKEKEEELEDLEALNQSLVVKERKSNDELVDARKVLISGLSEYSSRELIGVKRMGELDEKPFIAAAKRKGSSREDEENAIKLASLWQKHLEDPSWHPFKVITVDGQIKGIIDEEDEKIRSLKDGFDEDVYNTVVTALNELSGVKNIFNGDGDGGGGYGRSNGDRGRRLKKRGVWIRGLKKLPVYGNIGVKMVVEYKFKPFYNTLIRWHYNETKSKDTALKLCLRWQVLLRDPNWCPFKVIYGNDIPRVH